tara:strand:- start:4406 stop:4624 length:219 start_codon:yes stop_codon:yes gene_type:complete
MHAIYHLVEYKLIDDHYQSNQMINVYHSQLKMMEYIIDKFNNGKTYSTSQGDGLFVKCCSDVSRIFYVKKVN